MIKKTIALAIAVVLFGVAGYLAAQHYQTYQDHKTAEAASQQAKAEATQQQAIRQAQADRASAITQYNALRIECLKGVTAYSKLPLATQKLIGQPQCGGELK